MDKIESENKEVFMIEMKRLSESSGEIKYYSMYLHNYDRFNNQYKNIIIPAKNKYDLWLKTYDYFQKMKDEEILDFLYYSDSLYELAEDIKFVYCDMTALINAYLESTHIIEWTVI